MGGINTSQLVGFYHGSSKPHYPNLPKAYDCKCGGWALINGVGFNAQISCSKGCITIGGLSTVENLIESWNKKYSNRA